MSPNGFVRILFKVALGFVIVSVLWVGLYRFVAPPITFTVVGALPPGMTLSPTGLVSGTPTAAGTFIVQATDVNGCIANVTFTVIGFIVPVPTLPEASLFVLALLLTGIGWYRLRGVPRAD